MDIEKAHQIMQITKGTYLSDEYLKKRFRSIAMEIHPDKVSNPSKKLIAHYQFVELKKAYDFLNELEIDKRSIDDDNTSIVSDGDTEQTYKDNYIVKTPWWSFLYCLFFPGLLLFEILSLFLYLSIDEIKGIFKRSEVVKTSKYFYSSCFLFSLFFEIVAIHASYTLLTGTNRIIFYIIIIQALSYAVFMLFSMIIIKVLDKNNHEIIKTINN